MGVIDMLLHGLLWMLPAVVMGLLMVVGAGLCLPRLPTRPRWWVQWAVNSGVGALVLLGGLLLTGRDGKMVTYAALVLAMASSQWALLRAWRG